MTAMMTMGWATGTVLFFQVLQVFRVGVIFLSEMFIFIGAQHTSVTINHSSGARE